MEPCFASRRFPLSMILIAALDSIELVLRSVNLSLSEQFVLGADCDGYTVQVLGLDRGTFRDKLTLEDAVDPHAPIVAETNRLRPGVALFEKDVFEVCLHEGVLDRVAKVIKSLS